MIVPMKRTAPNIWFARTVIQRQTIPRNPQNTYTSALFDDIGKVVEVQEKATLRRAFMKKERGEGLEGRKT